jgi:hypothetical protein
MYTVHERSKQNCLVMTKWVIVSWNSICTRMWVDVTWFRTHESFLWFHPFSEARGRANNVILTYVCPWDTSAMRVKYQHFFVFIFKLVHQLLSAPEVIMKVIYKGFENICLQMESVALCQWRNHFPNIHVQCSIAYSMALMLIHCSGTSTV